MKRIVRTLLYLSPTIIILSCIVIHQSNTAPVVTLESPSGHFFKPNSIFNYKINVADKEDGMSKFDEIAPAEVYMKVKFLPDSNMIAAYLEKQQKEDAVLLVMKQNTCFNCHALQQKLAGPSFKDITQKYGAEKGAKNKLAQKIILGSKGVWGDSQQMPAHPGIQQQQALAIIDFILKTAALTDFAYTTGLEGHFKTAIPPTSNARAVYVLIPSYLDHGINGSGRKEGNRVVIIRHQSAQ